MVEFLSGGFAKQAWTHVLKPQYVKYIDSELLKSRHFQNICHFMLNDIVEGKLWVRTALESSFGNICHSNSVLESFLRKASAQTTEKSPIVVLPGTAGREVLLNCVNLLSARFVQGALCQQLGIPVKRKTFVLALCRECDPRWTGQEKLRALVVKQELLQNFTAVSASFTPSSLNDEVRMQTLAIIAASIRVPDNYGHVFTTIELAAPAISADELPLGPPGATAASK